MANKQRGEVEVAGRDGELYLMKLGTDAICRLEETLDRPVLSLFDELQKGTIRMTTVRTFVKASAVPPPDDAGAAEMIDNVGVMKMLDAMTTSLMLTFDIQAPKNGNGAAATNPQQPARRKAKTGAGSSKTPPQ